MSDPRAVSPTVAARFWEHVERGSDVACWLWLGPTNHAGYGRHSRWMAHRLAYEFLVGPIPDGLVIDHLCRNRRCVNPAHMEPVTNRENVLRGIGLSAQNARRTTCRNGHTLAGDNLRIRVIRGRETRNCRTCIRAHRASPERRDARLQQQARWRARHGAEYNARRREARRCAA